MFYKIYALIIVQKAPLLPHFSIVIQVGDWEKVILIGNISL